MLLFLVLQAVLLVSYMSWLTFLRAGFFISYGLLRFFLRDPLHVLALMTPGDRRSLLVAAALSALLATIAFALTTSDSRAEAPRGRPAVTVVAPLALLAGALGVYPRLLGEAEAVSFRKQTCYHSTPGLALLCSAVSPPPAPRAGAGASRPRLRIGDGLPRGQLVGRDAWNVVLIVVESLRRDSLEALGAGQSLMPTLDRLAAEGLVFSTAYAQSNATDYCVPALLSSLYPLRVTDHDFYKDIRYPRTLAYELLKRLGYRTAIFSSNNDRWGNTDAFLRSPALDLYFYSETYPGETLVPKEDMGFFEAISKGTLRKGNLDDKVTVAHFLDWLREGPPERPFFAYLNLQATHFPYQQAFAIETPFAPNRIDFEVSYLKYAPENVPVMRNRYWNSLRYVDARIRDVVEGLQALGRQERTLLVVLGDHGESFLEHQTVTHGSSTYDEEVRVPLVFHGGPARLPKGVDPRPIQQVDVVPTLLGLLGLPPHPNFQGVDVLDPARDPRDHKLFLTTQHGVYQDVLVYRGLKFALNHQGEDRLFDLARDPGETENLAGARPERAAQYRRIVQEFRDAQLSYYSDPDGYLLYYPPRHE